MADYKVQGNVCIITLNNPPVNALSYHVRTAFSDAMDKALKNDKVEAIVVCGRGRTFPVGADITEFGSGVSFKYPTIREMVTMLEESPKPTIAAIHGNALGGGLEVALGCHYRICSTDSMLGFPEVNLGILPAAYGSQRLPRLIGLDNAAEWIVFGAHYGAEKAKKLGIIDQTFKQNSPIHEYGVKYAKQVIGKPLDNRRLSKLSVKDAANVDEIMAKYKKMITLKSRGAMAPVVCLESTKASLLPFNEGIEREKECAAILMNSPESKALMYAFFAERKVRKWKIPGGVDHGFVNPLRIGSVAVIGLGTMGRGIALSALKTGVPVYVFEGNSELLKQGIESMKGVLASETRKGLISNQQRNRLEKLIKPAQKYQEIKNVDLVIEAVYEEKTLKNEIFRKLDKICNPSTILASNTSALNIDGLASQTKRPDKVIGMHFFAPAHLMKLLENIRGAKTSPQTIATAMDMGRKMDKVTVLVGNCYGFVANRMYILYMSESNFLLEEGAFPQQIDRVLTNFGFAMGRFQVADLSGNDVLVRVYNEQVNVGYFKPDQRVSQLTNKLVGMGRHGLKTGGKGWFKYDNVPRPEPQVDEVVTNMIVNHRKEIGVTPRIIDDQEIIERMLYCMVNEGFKILEEGMCAGPEDIDLVWIYGYAWPKHTGGPMFYASQVGLPKVLKAVQERWRKSGPSEPHWEPSQLLVNLVEKFGNPDINKWMKLSEEMKNNQKNARL